MIERYLRQHLQTLRQTYNNVVLNHALQYLSSTNSKFSPIHLLILLILLIHLLIHLLIPLSITETARWDKGSVLKEPLFDDRFNLTGDTIFFSIHLRFFILIN